MRYHGNIAHQDSQADLQFFEPWRDLAYGIEQTTTREDP
jgi:hypothetical protein